jgi:transposase
MIRGLAVVFGVRLPRALSPAFIEQARQASDGIPGLSAAMRGLIGARAAVLAAIVAIDADIRRVVGYPMRAAGSCPSQRQSMTRDASGDLAALVLISVWCRAVINRVRLTTRAASPSAAIGALVHSYEAANVMLTRFKGPAEAQGLGLRDRQNDRQCDRPPRSGPLGMLV